MATEDVWSIRTQHRLADETFLAILRAVYAGELKVGERLSVPALAERFGISRTPVREAIQRLVREGLATEQIHRGARLLNVSVEHLVQIYEVRAVLEGTAARYATERMSGAEIEELSVVLAKHHEAVDRTENQDHFEHDMQFHRLVRLGTRNQELVDALDRIHAKIRLAMMTTLITKGSKESAVEEHDAIFAAIQDRDPARAEQLAREHVAGRRAYLTATGVTPGHFGSSGQTIPGWTTEQQSGRQPVPET